MNKALACVRCGHTKPLDHFVNDRTRPRGKFPWCKPCVLESRKLRDRNPGRGSSQAGKNCLVCDKSLEGLHANRIYCCNKCKEKARNWRVFGLEPHEYRALLTSLGGRCPICRKNIKRWATDHNHKTGETTGVVCQVCNKNLLAFTYHDIELVRRLLDYLENPPVRQMFGERRYTGPENISNLDRMWGWSKAQHTKPKEGQCQDETPSPPNL